MNALLLPAAAAALRVTPGRGSGLVVLDTEECPGHSEALLRPETLHVQTDDQNVTLKDTRSGLSKKSQNHGWVWSRLSPPGNTDNLVLWGTVTSANLEQTRSV